MLKKINFNIIYNLLFIAILLYPLAIIYKISDFSVSYLFVLVIMLLAGVRFLYYINNLNSLYILSFYLIILFIINFINIKFFFFMFTFILFIVIGFNYKMYFINKKVIKKFINFSFVISIIGIILYFLKIPLFDFKIAGSEKYFMLSNGYYRAMSIFLNPNSFAYFIIFAFSLMLFYGKYIFFNKYYRKLYYIVFLFSLYIAYSRSAILSMVLILIVYGIYRFKISRKNKLLILFFMLIMLISFFMFLLSSRELFYNYDIRFLKIDIAIDYLTKNFYHFIFGYPHYINIKKNGISFSDNMFLYFFLRGGMILFILISFIYLKAILKSIIIIILKRIEIGYAVYLFSSIPLMFFSNFILFFPNVILFAISIGVILKGYK